MQLPLNTQAKEVQLPVGMFPFWVLPASACIISTFGVLATYFLAVKEGHVPPFPDTDITHAAIQYPEYIIFRATLIVGALLIGVVLSIVAWWIQLQVNKAQILPTGLPFINWAGWGAALLLCVSTASISDGHDMNWTVHVIGATGFFVVMIVVLSVVSCNYLNLYLKRQQRFISFKNFAFKMFLTLILIAQGALFVYCKKNPIPDWVGNALEWSLTLVVLLYVGSFSFDLYNVEGQLGYTESDEKDEYIVFGEQIENASLTTQNTNSVSMRRSLSQGIYASY